MFIKQIVNNNVVISENENGEIIVIGKGIGFKGRVGDTINPDAVEKTFVLQSVSGSDIGVMLAEIPYEVVRFGVKATDYIISCSKNNISRRILIPLTDHVYSCLTRYKEGIRFDTTLAFNVSFLYRSEYKIATDILDMLNSDFNTQIPEEEAAFITMHIVNAEIDVDTQDSFTVTDIINTSINMVEESFNIKLNNEDINFTRFVTHLQFFARRMIKNIFIEEDELSDINKHLNLRYAREYQCAKQIAEAISSKYNYVIDENEITYLTIHIARLLR